MSTGRWLHVFDGVVTMRFSAMAAAVCLSLLSVRGGIADAPGTAASASGVSAAAKPAPAPAAAPTGDAAAKHAKRTECLREAKTKKLVGAEKTAFLRSCIETP
jgi:hypothetical protein